MKIMKEIKININQEEWTNFFNEIIKEGNDDYKKYKLKFFIRDKEINNEKVDLWIHFTIKKKWNDFYLNFVYGIESEFNINKDTLKLIRLKIKTQINAIKNSWLIKTFNMEAYDSIFEKTWCWIIELWVGKSYLLNKWFWYYMSFRIWLNYIYNLFYFDILEFKDDQSLFVNNPEIWKEENKDAPEWNKWINQKGKLPDWFKWIDRKELWDDEPKEIFETKVEKVFLKDMWWNQKLKKEIWKIISFYKNKEHFKSWDINPPRWFILYWPPWTWKTFTAKIIANEIWINFYTLSSSDIFEKRVWSSTKNIKNFFNQVKTPCIVFLDEIDALVPNRSWEPHETTLRVINALLEEIDWIWEKKDILFIWATNRIEAIDPSILRAWRLDYKLFVDYPDFEARKEIWNIYLSKAHDKVNYDFLGDNIDLDILAKNTEKFTWSDINEIVRRLLNDYAIASMASDKINDIINWETTLKWLLFLINKYKDEKIINRSIVPIKPDIKMDDIWWSTELKKELNKIINQYKNKEIFEEIWASLPRWILLYWPPWTWKTLAAKAVAWEIWTIFYSLKAKDFVWSLVNESVKNIEKIFKELETPCIIFIDEIDAITQKRNNNTHAEDVKVLNAFLQQMDWFWEKMDILFIWATNRIDVIDDAILRAWRFDYKVMVDYPDLEARKEIFKIYINKSKTKSNKLAIFDENINYNILAEKSENFTWADINEIIRRLKQNFAIKESQNINTKNKKYILTHTVDIQKIIEEIEKYKNENIWWKKEEKIWFKL